MDKPSKFSFDIFVSKLSHSLDQGVNDSTGIVTNNHIGVESVKFGFKLTDHLNLGFKDFEIFLIHWAKWLEMVSSLDLIILWWFKLHLILLTVSIGNAVNVCFVDASCVREKLFLLDLRRYGCFQTDAHDSEAWRLDMILDHFNRFDELNLHSKAGLHMVLARFCLFKHAFLDFYPAWPFDSCVQNKQLQWSVGSSENILEVLTLPVRCWHVDVFITIPHFVVRPLWAANTINFKDVLLCFEFSNFNVNLLSFKSIINLLFGLSQKFFTQLFCFEFFFLQGKI